MKQLEHFYFKEISSPQVLSDGDSWLDWVLWFKSLGRPCIDDLQWWRISSEVTLTLITLLVLMELQKTGGVSPHLLLELTLITGGWYSWSIDEQHNRLYDLFAQSHWKFPLTYESKTFTLQNSVSLTSRVAEDVIWLELIGSIKQALTWKSGSVALHISAMVGLWWPVEMCLWAPLVAAAAAVCVTAGQRSQGRHHPLLCLITEEMRVYPSAAVWIVLMGEAWQQFKVLLWKSLIFNTSININNSGRTVSTIPLLFDISP